MTSVRKRTYGLILAAMLLMAIPIGDCGADCFYSCTENPEDAVNYYLGRDGNYHPIPSPPPVYVRGPAVYYRDGYPIPVPSEPPAYNNNHRDFRREAWRREFNEWHDQNHRDYVNGKR